MVDVRESKMLANAIRVLAVDAVSAAKSGHPGMPMGMADIAQVLWMHFLSHNPCDPSWVNRDRFILSNGHGSMLQYALLHLSGYGLSMEQIKRFRQLHSQTPGHPEFGDTKGIEATTGPLGQGLANGVGMAIAEKRLASEFNQPGHSIVDHHTYVFAGDGCLMEGISHEASSLAGTLGLEKLIVFWDNNGISIDGPVSTWFDEDVVKRYRAYGWHVIENVDGHDVDALYQSIKQAKAQQDRPTFIDCRTVIGWGAPQSAGKACCHGAPLSDQEIKAFKHNIAWASEPFELPVKIKEAWDAKKTGQHRQDVWQKKFDAYAKAHPRLAKEFIRRTTGQLPENWQAVVQAKFKACFEEDRLLATRQSSQQCIMAFEKVLPEMMGGSADLSESNLTIWPDVKPFTSNDAQGRYLHYGVREFGSFAIMNGLALHGGLLPFSGTFLVFIDYGRNAMRLSAMMKQRVIYVLTHDSIALGEDGPTHQPVEHLSILRATPGLEVWRPADGMETAVSWQQAIERQGPTALALSRQKVSQVAKHAKPEEIAKGAYLLRASKKEASLCLLASGSEVEMALQAAEQLAEQGIFVCVVSVPSLCRFLQQSQRYQKSILPDGMAKILIEAGHPQGWYPIKKDADRVIAVESYGFSAPGKDVQSAMGICAEAIVDLAKQMANEDFSSVERM